jgi:hypothetical protein
MGIEWASGSSAVPSADLRIPYRRSHDAPTYGRFSEACRERGQRRPVRHSECPGECDCFCHGQDGTGEPPP